MRLGSDFQYRLAKSHHYIKELLVLQCLFFSGPQAMEVEKEASEPTAQPTKAKREKTNDDTDFRKVFVPSHRYTPLKENWMKVFTPVVEHLKLQIRFNLKTRNVEIKAGKDTEDIANLQKAADFVRAFILGFDVDDALALLRLDDLFLDSFEVQVIF